MKLAYDVSNWQGKEQPERIVLEGRYVRLEPFSAARHGDELFSAVTLSDKDARFRYLLEYPPETRITFQPWLEMAEHNKEPRYSAVIDKGTGRVEGRQTLMRINAANGVIETGNILWGGRISRTPVSTEAFFLFAKYVFDDLGYRRFEWKCNNANQPSLNAALRFGFTAEGVFRQALVVKGKNRDTAWFSMLDHEWPGIKTMFERWLDPSNFDDEGNQIKRLKECRDS